MMGRWTYLKTGLLVLLLCIVSGEASSRETYRVKKGDTLSAIARKHGLSTDALLTANQLRGNLIRPNQVLTIPGAARANRTPKPSSPAGTSVYRVKKGDTLSSVSKKTGVPIRTIREINNMTGHGIRIGQTLRLAKPVSAADEPSDPNPSPAAEVPRPQGEGQDPEVHAASDPSEGEGDHVSTTEPLGKWKDPDERNLFIRVATAFLGAPYKYGGFSILGIDCSAFVKKIYEIFDITLPRTSQEQARLGLKVSRAELAEGDLVFFNTRGLLDHVGIYIGNDNFIHASSARRGVRIDSLASPYFDRRFAKAIRLKDIDEDV